MTRSQEFILKNRKKLACGADYFNPDSVLQSCEEYDKKKMKLLIIMPSPSETKSVSSTLAAINDYVISECPDVFVDFAYYPNQTDLKLFDKHQIPYGIGMITHLDASHFDMVGFSISVLSEVVTAPICVNSFSRCDTPIPLTWTERNQQPLGKHPILYAGGITAVCGDVMYGELGDGRQAFLDFTYLGSVERSQDMFDRYFKAQEVEDITIQGFIDTLFDMECIYQPHAYKVVFNDKNQIVENSKINPKAQDFVKPYYPHTMPDNLGIGRTYIPATGDNVGVSQTQVSEGCSAAGCCSFCAEGNYTGGWVEHTREKILEDAFESKKYSASYKYKPYSFNTNYITDYKGMLYDLMSIYPKVTFLNMRLEELGRDTDALRMMKLVGSNRVSAPIEGMSPRIQNNLLNKCLSTEALTNFMRDLVHLKMTDIKVGGIFTGYEEDEDFQWIVNFVDELKAKAKAEGGNLPFRLKVTPLVHYQLTPCEYLERKSAKKSLAGEHWLTDEWYQTFKDHNVYFKVNGFRHSTFLEQCVIDLGRSFTKLIYETVIKDMLPVYSLRSIAKDNVIEGLKKLVNADYFFETRDPDHYISLSHRVHIELMGSYIPRARRLVRAQMSGDVFANEPDIRCLKTYEGAKTKCYSNCAKIDPLKIYKDVKMDEDGNLHGEYRELNGCERCETVDLKKMRLTRPTPQTKNSDDIIGVPRIPQAQKIRFLLDRKPQYDLLNPNNTAHTPIAKLLQESPTLHKNFHSVVHHSMFWQSDGDQPYPTSGLQIVDTLWQADSLDEVRRAIPEVNKILKSVQIVSVSEELKEEKIKVDDFNVFYFESTLPYELFESSKFNYSGEVKVKTGMGLNEVRVDKDLKMPVFVSKGKVIGYFAVPVRYNPINYLQGFFTKKLSTLKIVETTTLVNKMVVRGASNVCRHCGIEKSTISLISGKPMPLGVECLTKALLSKTLK